MIRPPPGQIKLNIVTNNAKGIQFHNLNFTMNLNHEHLLRQYGKKMFVGSTFFYNRNKYSCSLLNSFIRMYLARIKTRKKLPVNVTDVTVSE